MLCNAFGAGAIGVARGFLATCAISAGLAMPLTAQEAATPETLADIRQQLSVLFVDVQRLKREMSTTGAPGGSAQGGTLLTRVDSIEAEMQKLTDRIETLGFRVDQVVASGTNRINDLNFRLCELEPACDIGTLQDFPRLGGAAGAPAAPQLASPIGSETGGAQLAIGEETDFQTAETALAEGRFDAATAAYDAFLNAYPGSPLTATAHLGRAKALKQLANTRESARAYLQAFSTNPEGPNAPEALTGLGVALGDLGQVTEACVTLSEVGARFPGDSAVQTATTAMGTLGCS